MLKDIHFEFVGFHGSPGRCQIRLARASKDQPLVVVCSQYKNYYGTSITNAHEIIAETLLYRIVNGEIKDVALDTPLPIYKEWHPDANILDKSLAWLFPSKYDDRFATRRLKVLELLSKLVWIEHYPANRGDYVYEKRVHLVTVGADGYPSWHGRPPDDWMMKRTGFRLDELLPPEDSLDLHALEKNVHNIVVAPAELQSLPGYHQVRWTKELLDFLPSLLTSARVHRGRSESSDLEEMSVHDELERYFTSRLPARELFIREYPFSKALGIHASGREKAADFAILSPLGTRVEALLEIKRTSSKSGNLCTEVADDIGRLALLTHRLRSNCYLLVCGNTETVKKELGKMADSMSLDDDDAKRDRAFKLSDQPLSRETRRLLASQQIDSACSRLQGIVESNSNCVVLWQIAVDSARLKTHAPYIFNLTDPAESR